MISLVIPTTSKNREYTDNLLNCIRELYGGSVEVIVEENDNVTLGENYNNAVRKASGDKIILLHNDMVISAGFVETMDKHITKNRITTYTRIEPPIFNDTYPGKVLLDCGADLTNFDSNKFAQHKLDYDLIDGGSQLFFGCMREDYIGIDGNTFKMFCEDDDLHKRYKLKGFEHKVSSASVYHFVSKTSRSTTNYQEIEVASNRNYIRKWGSRSNKHKYNIAFVVHNCNLQLLEILEPWCDRIYVEEVFAIGRAQDYIEAEQVNTIYDLSKRVVTIDRNDPVAENDVVLEFNAQEFTQQSFNIIQQLPDILSESGEIGAFELDCFKITINSLETYEKTLIICNTTS